MSDDELVDKILTDIMKEVENRYTSPDMASFKTLYAVCPGKVTTLFDFKHVVDGMLGKDGGILIAGMREIVKESENEGILVTHLEKQALSEVFKVIERLKER